MVNCVRDFVRYNEHFEKVLVAKFTLLFFNCYNDNKIAELPYRCMILVLSKVQLKCCHTQNLDVEAVLSNHPLCHLIMLVFLKCNGRRIYMLHT